jgi:hypothetical protein
MPTLLDKTKVLETIRAQALNNTSKAIFSAIASMGNPYPPCCKCDFYNKKEHRCRLLGITIYDSETFFCQKGVNTSVSKNN